MGITLSFKTMDQHEENKNEEIEQVGGPEFAVAPELFGKWKYDNVECSDISLQRYLQTRDVKQRVFIPFTAGRYQKRRFKKASYPLVERLTNMMMTSGHRNNGSKQRAVRIIQLRRKQLAREESEKDETEWSAQWQVAKERLTEEEEAERGWVRQRNVDVTNFNIQLREEKKMERQILRQTSLEAASRASEILGEEDARFDQYATACMNEWHQGGKTCKPMRILLGKGESVTE